MSNLRTPQTPVVPADFTAPANPPRGKTDGTRSAPSVATHRAPADQQIGEDEDGGLGFFGKTDGSRKAEMEQDDE